MRALSVLMSVYNGSKYLQEAIESILNQTYTDFRFIIIDDASTDDTHDILFKYARLDPRIIIITNEQNLGLATSLNYGLNYCDSVYVARFDADDIAKPDRLQKQLNYMIAHPYIDILGGALQCVDANGIQTEIVTYPLSHEEIVKKLTGYGGAIAHPSVCMRVATIKSVNGYRTKFRSAQDYDLWLRLVHVAKFANLADVIVVYKKHEMAISHKKAEQQAINHILALQAYESRQNNMSDFIDKSPLTLDTVLENLTPCTYSLSLLLHMIVSGKIKVDNNDFLNIWKLNANNLRLIGNSEDIVYLVKKSININSHIAHTLVYSLLNQDTSIFIKHIEYAKLVLKTIFESAYFFHLDK